MRKMIRMALLSVLVNFPGISLSGCAVDRAGDSLSVEARGETLNIVRNRDELQRRMQEGPTPLDAFTTFGKREFLAGLVWGAGGSGIGGLSTAPLIRELRVDQIISLLTFLGLKDIGNSIAASLPLGVPLRFPEPDAEMERNWREVTNLIGASADFEGSAAVTTDTGHADVIARYRASLEARMDEGELRGESLGNLLLLFEVAADVSMSSGDADASRDTRAVFSELERRHIDTRRGFDQTMRKAFLAQRQFDLAREFLALHPDPHAEAIPKIVDSLGPSFNGRSVLDLDRDKGVFNRIALPVPASTQIIMLVGPTCHFSLDALSAIAEDRSLLDRLRQHDFIALTPPGASLELSSIGAWNARHPKLPMRIPWSRQEWKEVDLMQVPQFLIFENGKLAQRIVGWKGNQGVLNDALAARETPQMPIEQK